MNEEHSIHARSTQVQTCVNIGQIVCMWNWVLTWLFVPTILLWPMKITLGHRKTITSLTMLKRFKCFGVRCTCICAQYIYHRFVLILFFLFLRLSDDLWFVVCCLRSFCFQIFWCRLHWINLRSWYLFVNRREEMKIIRISWPNF